MMGDSCQQEQLLPGNVTCDLRMIRSRCSWVSSALCRPFQVVTNHRQLIIKLSFVN